MSTNDQLEAELHDAATELHDIGMHSLADAVTVARGRLVREAPAESGAQLALEFASWRHDQQALEKAAEGVHGVP